MRIVPSRPRPMPWSVRVRRGALGAAIGTLGGALLWPCGGPWWLGSAAGILSRLFPFPTDPPVIR
jgi:hypothetical protein